MKILISFVFLVAVAQARPGAVQVFVFDQGAPRAGVVVAVGGVEGATDRLGTVRLQPPAGAYPVLIDGRAAAEVLVADDLLAEVLVTRRADGQLLAEVEARALPAEEQPAEAEGPPATLVGTVRAEGGAPVADVKVYARGRAEAATTDAQGRFTLTLPAGSHRLSLIHADFRPAAQDVELPPEGTTIAVELLAAALALDDLEVVAPYIEGGVVALDAERQGQSAVVDVIGAEQMAKSGDGDAAGALRRVTGLTVVGGKYVYVRGMGERYSATLLDGVTLPSPEPERRVVPLDLFPTGPPTSGSPGCASSSACWSARSCAASTPWAGPRSPGTPPAPSPTDRSPTGAPIATTTSAAATAGS